MGRVSEPAPTRPRQVTLAGWLIMAGSAIVVGLVFDRLAGLHTIETRESVERFLAEPPGADLGVGVDRVLTMIRTFAMVAAGCATAAAILGYHVLRRSRSARVAVTVLAVPLFVTGMVTGGFFSSLVAASVVMLWLQPARDWFRDAPPSLESASTPGFGDAPAAADPRPGPAERPHLVVHPSGLAPVRPVAPARRPAAVTWACVLTWVSTGVTTLAMALSAVALAVEQDSLFEEARRQNPELTAQGVSDGVLAAVAYAMVGFVVAWCVAAAVVAILVLRRVAWARIALVVSASVAASISLLGAAVGAFLLTLPLVAAIATLALLVRPDVGPWFRSGGRTGS